MKESQKMLQWMKMDTNKLKWARRACLESISTFSGQCQEETCYKISYKLRKQQKMEEF
jgi:hypothetical protein